MGGFYVAISALSFAGLAMMAEVGERHIKLMVVVACFAPGNSLFKALINSSQGFKALMGNRAFMPDSLG